MNKLTPMLLGTCLLLSSCNDDDIYCTEEFRVISIEVVGEPLTEHYSIRQSNSDTIRHNDEGGQTYTVLDDNYLSQLKNQQDTFRFQGFINDTLRVDELFVIKADECHVIYVSGRRRVQL
ncbi:MAG: hypothetical protein EA358_11000 [Flavobacteriales bacterium]|nr:MAG: hypothetical protein EA358_11000 [Flavobacteriales bacterium]